MTRNGRDARLAEGQRTCRASGLLEHTLCREHIPAAIWPIPSLWDGHETPATLGVALPDAWRGGDRTLGPAVRLLLRVGQELLAEVSAEVGEGELILQELHVCRPQPERRAVVDAILIHANVPNDNIAVHLRNPP